VQKGTAIKVGRALLEECFPGDFSDRNIPIGAEEKMGFGEYIMVRPTIM
jgi:hypothetical protein